MTICGLVTYLDHDAGKPRTKGLWKDQVVGHRCMAIAQQLECEAKTSFAYGLWRGVTTDKPLCQRVNERNMAVKQPLTRLQVPRANGIHQFGVRRAGAGFLFTPRVSRGLSLMSRLSAKFGSYFWGVEAATHDERAKAGHGSYNLVRDAVPRRVFVCCAFVDCLGGGASAVGPGPTPNALRAATRPDAPFRCAPRHGG